MALVQNRSLLDSSVTLESAYIRVKAVQATQALSAKGLQFSIEIFASQADRDANKSSLHELHFNLSEPAVSLDFNSNPFVLVYDHLKTLPEFSGAVDA